MIAVRVTWFVVAAAIAFGVALLPPHDDDPVVESYVCIQPPSGAEILGKELDALDALHGRIAAAITTVVEAQSDDERAVAKAELDKLRKERDDLRRGIAELRAAIAAAHRRLAAQIPARCLDNPLAPGCN